MKWGAVIRRIREDKGMTQQNIADELGVNVTTIVRWEQEDNIKTPQLEKIAKALGVKLSDLYSYHTNPSLLEDPLTLYLATAARLPKNVWVQISFGINTTAY